MSKGEDLAGWLVSLAPQVRCPVLLEATAGMGDGPEGVPVEVARGALVAAGSAIVGEMAQAVATVAAGGSFPLDDALPERFAAVYGRLGFVEMFGTSARVAAADVVAARAGMPVCLGDEFARERLLVLAESFLGDTGALGDMDAVRGVWLTGRAAALVARGGPRVGFEEALAEAVTWWMPLEGVLVGR